MTLPEPVCIDLDLLELIYDVALGRSAWVDVLDRLRAEFATEASLLAVFEQSPALARSLGTTHGDARRWQQYAEHFATIDPFIAAMRSGRAPAGLIVTGDDLVPAKEFCASEYFNDWFRPNGMRHTARGYIRIHEQQYLQLGMPRSPAAGSYTADERARLQRYFNHICRARLIEEERQARTKSPDYDQVARAFGLTAAEARLCEGLARNGSLRRSAQATHRSYYTLRAHLRSVFLKTGVRSQVELMRLLHQGLSGWPGSRTAGSREP
jgi:DNA-binding CsgD family transcriptional regulator